MNRRQISNVLITAIAITGLSYYQHIKSIPEQLFASGIVPTPENVAHGEKVSYFMLAYLSAVGVVIWLVLNFLAKRGLIPGLSDSGSWSPSFPSILRGRGSLNHLLVLCGGSRSLAERLINYELKRSPGLDRRQAIQRAAGRLEYDRCR